MAGAGLPRPIDAAIAAFGLVVLSPMIAASALAVRVTSPGPMFFRHRRVGRHGRVFELCKLRTMRVATGGPQLTASDDSRTTAVGRFLRRAKLDELPGLWNVLRGDMALVGPRPEVPEYVDLDDPLRREILETRPGMTDPISIHLRDEEDVLAEVEGDREAFYLTVLQPYKLIGTVEYLRVRTPWSDLRILLETALIVFARGRSRPPTRAHLEERVAAYRATGELIGLVR